MNIIIVAGISGINKAKFIKNFITKAKISKKSKIIRFEDELVNPRRRAPNTIPPTTVTSFLEKPSSTYKVNNIEQTFAWITNNLKIKQGVEYVFLDIHLTYHKRSEFFPPLNPSHFMGWIDSIDRNSNVKIITLIDDIFNISQVLSEREKKYPNTKLTLREILGWRSLETLQAESLGYSLNAPGAGNKQVKTFMVSVRHPFSTFKSIILAKVPITVYLSFPISRTRFDKKMIKEVNEFRKRMHKIGEKYKVTVLDPVSIDELILEQAIKESKNSVVNLDKKNRWPLDYAKILVPNKLKNLTFSRKEIDDSIQNIKHQVRSRDLKLVETAALLCVYRPFFPKLSTGVKAEIDHATSIGNDLCVYSPKKDNPSSSGNPFDSSITFITNNEKFYKTVEQKLIDLKRKLINR